MLDLDQIRMTMLSDHDRRLLEHIRQQEEVSRAGRELRKLRTAAGDRPPKRYTGYLTSRRKGWVGQKILLPNGIPGEIAVIRRRLVLAHWVDPLALAPDRVAVLNRADVRPLAHPAARVLGRLKLGREEQPSELKSRTARRNGSCPVRKGSRPRGRPRKVHD